MRAGNLLIALGVIAIVAGLLLRYGLLSWFGHLPGDFRIQGERTSVYIPITSMLLVSLVLSVVVTLLARWFGSE